MNCKNFSKALAALNQGEEWSPEMKTHLAVCHECNLLAHNYTSFLDVVEVEKTFQVSPYTATRVLAEMEAQSKSSFTLVLKPSLVMAFTIAFVIGLSATWFISNTKNSIENSDIVTDYFTELNSGYFIEQSWINIDDYEE